MQVNAYTKAYLIPLSQSASSIPRAFPVPSFCKGWGGNYTVHCLKLQAAATGVK